MMAEKFTAAAKKILAALMACITVLSLMTLTSASAAGVSQQTAQQTVSALGIMVGDASGDMRLDDCVTRAQLAKILVALSFGDVTLASSVSPFPDVPFTHWAAPYVSRAVSAGYVSGYPDGTFKPDNNTKTEEVVKTLLAVLGYTSADYGVGYPYAQLTYASKLGLLDGVNAQAGSYITRRNVMYLIYNTLTATAKSGRPYAATLGYTVTAAGAVDISALITENSVGPITVRSLGWHQGTGLSIQTAAVYMNDQASTFDAITPGTVVYYSVDMNTIWAYSKKVTGLLDNVLPSRLSPASVVVSGTTYPLGSTAASEALSYNGTFKYGDVVTLLFGRGGSVVDIIKADSYVEVIGIVTGAGSKPFTDSDGLTKTVFYVKFLTLEGDTLEYRVPSNLSSLVGYAVRLTFNGTTPEFSRVGSTSTAVSGKVSEAGMTIGSAKMASDIRILDTDDYGNTVILYPQRLDGVTLSAQNVMYCKTDANGAVTQLVLKNVTGDTSFYGILIGVPGSESNTGTYTYRYNINGTISSSTLPIEIYADRGPSCITFQNNSIAELSNLKSMPNVKLSGFNAVVSEDGAKHLLWDKGTVFILKNGEYELSTLSAVSKMSLTAYYDKPEAEGGLVRMIIAQ